MSIWFINCNDCGAKHGPYPTTANVPRICPESQCQSPDIGWEYEDDESEEL